MDLKIRDVAELLNVSETTVRRWLVDGKIPAYNIQGLGYRFSRMEIESWVLNHKYRVNGNSPFSDRPEQKTKTSATTGNQKFSLDRALHKGYVFNNVKGKTKEEVIRQTTQLLSQQQRIDNDMLEELLLRREMLQPTALNNGVAVPHTRDFLLSSIQDLVAIVFPEREIDYGSLDDLPVHTMIFLFACNDKRHLHLLAKIAHLSSQPAALELFKKRPGKKPLLEFIHKWESRIPAPNED
jgi:PTS system nitrogen regulatory IIA component